MLGRPKSISNFTTQQLKETLKDVESCSRILSNQIFPEKLFKYGFQSIFITLDFVIINLINDQNLFEKEKINFGIGWGVFFSTMMISLHLSAQLIGSDLINALLVSRLSESNRNKINMTANQLGIKISDTSAHQLELFQQKKAEIENIISERTIDEKAFHFFASHCQKDYISNDISNSIKEFITPKTPRKI